MELSSVLDKIRGLIAKAESLELSKDPNAQNEANACRERADAMMQKYAVQEWQAMAKAPVASKPTRIKIDLSDTDNPFLEEMATLVHVVAQFCKCSSIWIHSGLPGGKDFAWVYGYESDLRYFELLYTTLFLHMSGAIFPGPDPALSLEDNVYQLHNAGLNWYDIARAYGWTKVPPRPTDPPKMYVHKDSHERAPQSKAINVFKKAYERAIEARGEEFLRIPPSGSMTFRRNSAQGYLNRINDRLREISGARGKGNELVLADKSQNVKEAMLDDYPHSKSTEAKKVKFNADAYNKGNAHANTANLNPAAEASSRASLGRS